MRVLAHRAVGKDHLAAAFFKLFKEEDLVDIFAGEAIWLGQEDDIKARLTNLIAQPVEAGTLERRPTVAFITKHGVLGPLPLLSLTMGLQPLQLLFNGLGLALVLGRDADVQRNSHRLPASLGWIGSAKSG